MVSSGDAKPRSWALKVGLALAGVGLLAFLYAVSAAVSKPDESGYRRFATGALKALVVMERPAPQSSRSFQTADGFAVKLSNFRGKVVVMNLWASWCAPCVAEMPTLGALQAAYAGRDLVVAPISIDQPRARARAIADLAKLADGKLTFYTDPTAAIAYDSGAGAGMPTTVIFARDGREIARLAGAANWNSPEAHALIEAALAEQAGGGARKSR